MACGDGAAVFLGVAGAFVVQSGVAVSFGSVLTLLPAHVVKVGTGLFFLAAAVWMWAPPKQSTSC